MSLGVVKTEHMQAAALHGYFSVQKATAVILDINKDHTLLQA